MIRAAAWLNLRHFRTQPLRAVLAILAIAGGSGVVMAVGTVSHSITAAADSFAQGIAGVAPLRIVGADTQGALPNALAPRIRAVSGVAAAVPVIMAVSVAEDRHGSQTIVADLGVDCSVQALLGDFGCSQSLIGSPATTAPPLVAPSLLRDLGPDAALRTDQGRIPLGQSPILPQLDRFNHGRVAVFPLPEAERVLDRPGADVIYVKPRPGTSLDALRSRLATVIGAQNHVVPADQASTTQQQAAGFVPLLGLVGLAAIAMAGDLVGNIVTLSLAERRRDLAVASAIGATRRTVVIGVLLEAGLLGAGGGLVGVVLGAGLSLPLVSSVSTQAERFAGVALAPSWSAFVVVLTVGLGCAVAILYAVGPARRATAVDVMAELSERQVSTPLAAGTARRGAILVALGVAGLGLTFVSQLGGTLDRWQPVVGQAGLVVCIAALISAVGSWTPVVLRGLSRWLGDRAGSLTVALSNMASEPTRTAGMAVAVAAAVALGAGLGGIGPSLRNAINQSFGRISGQRVFVSALQINNSGSMDAKLSPAEIGRLASLPGVASVDSDYFLTTGYGHGTVTLSAFAIPATKTGFAEYQGGSPLQVLNSGGAMISPGVARSRGLRPGSLISLDAPSGIVKLRVGGIWADPNNTGYDVVLSRATMFRIWGPQPPQDLWLQPARGVSPGLVAAEATAAHLAPDIRAYAPAAFIDEFAANVDQQIQPFWVLQRGFMGLALFASLSTLLLIGVQRRREIGLLSALGMSRTGLVRLTALEAAGVGAVGSLLGAGFGTLILAAFKEVSGFLFGLQPRVDWAGLPAPMLFYCLLAVLAVLVGGGLPAWRAGRLEPAVALRYE